MKNILTDAEVMREAEDFLAARDSLCPSIRGRDELCMFAERIARLAAGQMRVASALLAECEAVIGAVDPECDSEAEQISKLRAQIVDFLAGESVSAGDFCLQG